MGKKALRIWYADCFDAPGPHEMLTTPDDQEWNIEGEVITQGSEAFLSVRAESKVDDRVIHLGSFPLRHVRKWIAPGD